MADYLKKNKHLIEFLQATRSEKKFRLVYRAYTPVLYRVAFRLLDRNRANADDVVQETWVRAIEKADSYQGNSRIQTWLVGIVINCCREFRRKNSNFQSRDVDVENDINAVSPNIHNKMDLETALAKLAEGYRDVLILYDIEGFTHREISEMLDISEGTSKSQLSRGRYKIREFLTSDKKR